jgi:hypothetical protein
VPDVESDSLSEVESDSGSEVASVSDVDSSSSSGSGAVVDSGAAGAASGGSGTICALFASDASAMPAEARIARTTVVPAVRTFFSIVSSPSRTGIRDWVVHLFGGVGSRR